MNWIQLCLIYRAFTLWLVSKLYLNFLVGSGSRDLVGLLGSQNLSSLPTWSCSASGCINDYTVAIISLHLSVLKQKICCSKDWVAILSNCVVAQHTYLCTSHHNQICLCLSYYHSWVHIVNLLDNWKILTSYIQHSPRYRAGIHATCKTPRAISKTIELTKWVLFVGLLLSNQKFERSK